jgi:hypothetical protein
MLSSFEPYDITVLGRIKAGLEGGRCCDIVRLDFEQRRFISANVCIEVELESEKGPRSAGTKGPASGDRLISEAMISP